MENKGFLLGSLIALGVLVVVIMAFVFCSFVTIQGKEVGVRENVWSGVENEPLYPATYFVMPWQHVEVYSTAIQVFVMNDRPETDAVEGREVDSYLVQSNDNQDMRLEMQVQWRIDPNHVVDLHKQIGKEGIAEKALRPTLLRVVKDHATMLEAIEAYSGQGLVTLQSDIEKALRAEDGDLAKRGVIVESFVIEHIALDEEYVTEIKARQVAEIRELRAVQEEKAAQAEALKAKAVAQSDLNKAVVEAQRDKEVAVLKAEAEAEQVTLAATAAAEQVRVAAQADKEKMVLAAEGEKESGELKAAAILALGTAEAEAQKLQMAAYETPGSEVYAKIEVAKSMKDAFGGIKGYLPQDMSITTLSGGFFEAVESVMSAKGQPLRAAAPAVAK